MGLTNVDIELLAGLNLQSSEQEILKAIKILQKNLQVNEQAKIKLDVQIDQAKIQQIVSTLQQLSKRSDLSTSTHQSITNITKEATQLTSVAKATEQVIQKKNELTKANKEVTKSAKDAETNMGKQISGMNMNASANSVQKMVNQLNHMNNTATYSHSIFGNLKNAISHTFSSGKLAMTSYLAILRGISTAAKDAKEAITELNQAETDLMIATNMSRESVKGLIKDYNTYGKQLASTTTEITDAADDYLRAGKALNESQALIKDSIMLSKLGQIDSDEATEDLLATMNGYNMAVDQVDSALDAMVAIDMKAATSAGDLATGLKYSASSANAAGLEFNKLVAMLGTVQDKTQQTAQVVGTFANTILSRYRDITIGKYLSDDGEDISNYESVLKSVGIELRDSSGEFRAFENVLEEMADKWDSLTSVQQNALIKVAAGTRQQNRFIALMENYNKVLELTEVAATSAGIGVDKFNSSYMTSLEAKQNTLQASFESMIYNVNMDEVYGDILDSTTAMVEFIDKANLLKGVMTGLTVGAGVKGFLTLKTGIHQAYISLNQFQNALNMVKQTNISNKDFKTLLLLTNGLSDSQTKLLLSTKNLNFQQKQQILIAQGLSAEEAKLKLQSWGLASAQTGLTASTTSLKGALQGLWATMMANPLFLVVTGVTAAVSIFTSYKNKMEEVRQATADAATAYGESSKSIDDYVSRYQDLQKALQDAKGNEESTATVKQQLLDLQNELNNAYGTEYGKLNLVTDAYKDQTEAIKELSKAEANRYLNENRQGISTATKKMEKEREYVLSYGNVSYSKKGKELKNIAEEHGIEIETNSVSNEMTLVLKADAEEAYEIINDFESELRERAIELGDEHLFDDVLEVSSSALNKAKSVVDEYGDIYHQALMAQLVTNDDASEVYESALTAVEEYNQAVAESEDPYNDEKVAKAKANVEAVKAQVENSEDTLGKFSSIFDDVFEQADTRLLDFNEKLKSDISMQDWANQLKGLSQTELLSMADDGTEDTFDKLVTSAEEYDLTVEELIDALIRLGYVQGEVASQDISSGVSTVAFDYESFSDSISAISDSYNTLTTAVQEYNENGAYSLDTVNKLMALKPEYLALLVNESGQLAINEQGLRNIVQAQLEKAQAEIYAVGISKLNALAQQEAGDAATSAGTEMANAVGDINSETEALSANAQAAIFDAKAKSLLNNKTDNITDEDVNAIIAETENQVKALQAAVQGLSFDVGGVTGGFGSMGSAANKASDAVDELTESLKEQKEVLEGQKEEYEALYDSVQWLYDSKIDDINDEIDGLKKVNELLEEQKSNLDDVMSAMKSVYQTEIDSLQAKIDAMDESNEKAKLELQIEKAKQALLEAKSRKNVLQYEKGKGFIYTQSESDIKDAESELEDANAEKVKQGLKDQIEIYQSYIDKLDEIPKAYTKAMQKIATSKYLGADWATAILNPSDDLFANLETDYTGIESDIAVNEEKIDTLQAEKERIEALKDLWEDAKNSFIEAEHEARLKAFFGSDYEYQLLHNSATWRKQFATEYADVCRQIEEIEERIKTASEQTTSSVASNAGKATSALKGTKSTLEEMESVSTYLWTDQDDLALAFAEQRLSHLNNRISEGATGLTDAQSKVQNFVNEYGRLKESGTVTDELKASIEELNTVSEFTGVYFGNMIAGVSDRLADMSNYTDSIVTNAQLTADTMNELDAAMQSVTVSEEAIETEVDTTATELETTVTNLLTKLDTLKTALAEIKLSTDEVETVADEEILDTSEIVDGIHTKVTEIQNAITTLTESITPLQTALDTLMQKMGELDKVTLSNVIGALGGASGSESKSESNQSATGMDSSSGEDSTGSGLLGAIKAVDEAIGSVDDTESLLGKLQELDDKTLENIIAQFGSSDTEDSVSLLSAVKAVTDAIIGTGKDDDNSLIASIERLGADGTVQNVTTVKDSFTDLLTQIQLCVDKIGELADSIINLPTASGAGVSIPGYAKGTRKAKKGVAAVAENGAEIITDGENVVLATEPTLVNMKGGEQVYTATETKKILSSDGISELTIDKLNEKGQAIYHKIDATSLSKDMLKSNVLNYMMNGLSINMKQSFPEMDKQGLKHVPEVTNVQNSTVNIGDIHLHEVQNIDSFGNEIIKHMPNTILQKLKK